MKICCPFCRTFNPKDKSKTVGFARQQLHFLCGDKENEAKENLALRWACFTRFILVANMIGINLW
jgi:hypothetical protein